MKQAKTGKKTRLLDRKLPTLLGLVFLLVGLGAGIMAIGSQQIFTPRATPQTTPKKIKITNVTDSTFTVSFVTDEATTGFVKYGTTDNSLKTQASDDRDQLAGTVNTYQSHHITVRGLQPQTRYFFTLGTGSNAAFDDNGKPFSVQTGTKPGTSSVAQTVYGTVLTASSTPAENAIVYVKIDGTQELSTLVRSSGTWAIPLSSARTADGKGIPKITSTSPVLIQVQGQQVNLTAELQTTVGQPQLPIQTITLGGTNQVAATATPDTNQADTDLTPSYTSTPSASVSPVPSASASATPRATAIPSASPIVTASPSATPEPDVSLPATDEAIPVSGSGQQTAYILMVGMTLLGLGSLGWSVLTARDE